jgi:hypothetical protein
MAAGEVMSIAEHWDVLWYFLIIVVGGGVGETLRRLARMEKKQDEQRAIHENCRLTLLSKQEFKDWKDTDFANWREGRDGPGGLWHALNNHSHVGVEGPGKVIKT